MVELSSIVILGISAQWLAWKSRVPAILPLIIIGLIVGPLSQYWLGEKLIDPMNEGGGEGEGLFLSETMFSFVSLAIGVILFEGGLTLKFKEFKSVGSSILRLVSVGSLITFVGGGLAAHYICALDWQMAFLFSALIIVTGPTVIAPILRNVPLTRNVATVLKWEGILIDPIGALSAVLVFGFISVSHTGGLFEMSLEVLWTFMEVLLVGVAFGVTSAHFLRLMIKNELIPEYLLNVFTLALVLSAFVFSDHLAHESGLLTVVIMGMVLANIDVPRLKEILDFKESLTILLISILFVLLAANINYEELQLLNLQTVYLFLAVVFVLRPMSVFASTIGSDLTFNEKLFISWVGPRGIVAAGIASLFGLKLVQAGIQTAEIITPLVFAIVLGTVLLNATTARLMARLLNVKLDASDGIMIIGANRGARLLAQYLEKYDKHVVLIDNSEEMIEKAEAMGLEAIQDNIYKLDLTERFELLDMGYLLAMTGSDNVNQYACRNYRHNFGENGTYRLMSKDEIETGVIQEDTQILFNETTDFLKLNETARNFPTVRDIKIDTHEELMSSITKLVQQKSIPVFVRHANNKISIVSNEIEDLIIEKGASLVYLGEEL